MTITYQQAFFARHPTQSLGILLRQVDMQHPVAVIGNFLFLDRTQIK